MCGLFERHNPLTASKRLIKTGLCRALKISKIMRGHIGGSCWFYSKNGENRTLFIKWWNAEYDIVAQGEYRSGENFPLAYCVGANSPFLPVKMKCSSGWGDADIAYLNKVQSY